MERRGNMNNKHLEVLRRIVRDADTMTYKNKDNVLVELTKYGEQKEILPVLKYAIEAIKNKTIDARSYLKYKRKFFESEAYYVKELSRLKKDYDSFAQQVAQEQNKYEQELSRLKKENGEMKKIKKAYKDLRTYLEAGWIRAYPKDGG